MFNISFIPVASSSAGNFYLLHGFKTKIMIECGIDIAKIGEAINHKYSDYQACFVSHAHGDHAKSVLKLANKGVNIYSNSDICSRYDHHRIKEIAKTIKIGEFIITPFEVEHDVQNFGYMIDSELSGERLVFIIDTYYSPVTFSSVTHFVIEANHCEDILRDKLQDKPHYQRLWNTHMSIERCVKTLKANDMCKVKQVFLTHLSGSNSDPEHMKNEIINNFGIVPIIC